MRAASQLLVLARAAHWTLHDLARMRCVKASEMPSRARRIWRRNRLIAQMNAAYAELHADPQAWADEMAERELWDQTSADGLEDEPPYAE